MLNCTNLYKILIKIGCMGLTEHLFKDPWKDLRLGLFRNVEPRVKLIAITQPVRELAEKGVTPETIPAYTARHCYESFDKYNDDPTNNHSHDLKLTKSLILRDHQTPLQALSYVFDVFGTTKSLQAQWTRHKIGVGWSYRSTRFVEASGNEFVYNAYDYIQDEEAVKKLLSIDESINRRAIEVYGEKRELGATKQDARKIMPVQFATHCSFFANARSLRHLFNLRLDKHAEWEIRRMSAMMLDELMLHTPEVFRDIYDDANEVQ